MEKSERETIISWNDAESTVNVFTCHRAIMTKMNKLKAKVKRKVVIAGRTEAIEYEVPKDKITIGLNAKRVCSRGVSDALKKARGQMSRGNDSTSKKDCSKEE